MRIVGFFVPMNNKRVLISSGMGKGIFDSPLLIYNEMKSNSFFNDFDIIWAVTDPSKYEHEFKVVKIDTIKYFYYALSSKIWVTSVNIERGLKFKKRGTIYLNTWHGVPLKKIGLDVKSRNDYDFSHVDYFLSSGRYEDEIYKRAFNLADKSLLRTGNPRNIALFETNSPLGSDEKEVLLEQLGKPDHISKKIILFAPTWKDYDYKKINLSEIIQGISDDYVIYAKLHPLEKFEITEERVFDLSTVSDIATLLPLSDMIISDYSSVMIDYSILRKPIIAFIPDYEEYERTRGMYVTKEDIAPNIFENENDIINFINKIDLKEEFKKTSDYSQKFLEYDPITGMSEIIDTVIEEYNKRL